MNLFEYVEEHGTVEGYVGTAFFEKPAERFLCKICGKEVPDVKRFTCSRACAKIYLKMIQKRQYLRYAEKQKEGSNPDYVKIGRAEFKEFIFAKYGDGVMPRFFT